jgi:phosphatidylethanolamine/phosphatidyl-N-methylethanolamine N-methyltransferase
MEIQLRRRQSQDTRALEFFKGFLRNPKEVGSLIPSSRFLTRRVLASGLVSSARVIIELGPGTGVLTGEILSRMPSDGKLIAVELMPRFARVLEREFHDPRLAVYEGSSANLEKALAESGEERADLVVSGIPFSTMEAGEGRRTLEAAKRVLGPGGRFVAYQFRSRVRDLAEPFFGPAETQRELRNLPPMRIYMWKRTPHS